MLNKNFYKAKLPIIQGCHIPTLMFIIFLLVGLNIYSDYGVSFDEPDSRTTGFVNIKHILQSIGSEIPEHLSSTPSLDKWINKDYGVGFELPICSAELILSLKDLKEVYEFRHLANFLLFFLAVLAMYFCILLVTKRSVSAACFGFLLMILSPRIFAESFYNCKDLVFLSSAAFYAFFQAKSVLSRKILWSFLLAISIAFSGNIRIMGVLFWVSALFVELGGLLFRFTNFRESWKNICIILFIAPLFFFTLFPYLWDSPFLKFGEVFSNMSHFRWTGRMLFNGSQVWSTELPFYYATTWILITTPVLYSFFFLIGISLIIRTTIKGALSKTLEPSSMLLLLFAILFFTPLFSVVAMKSVLYDGWRQLYFIYPFFVVIASFAFYKITRIQKYRIPLLLCCCLFFIHMLITMVRSHPNQNLYFNFLAGGDIKNRWDYDYWGLSNTTALKEILMDDGRPHISIAAISASVLDRSSILLDPSDRERVDILPIEDNPDYVFNNYRQFNPISEKQLFQKGYQIYKRYRDDNEVYLSIYAKNPSQSE